MSGTEELDLELVHPGDRDPAAVDQALDALAEFLVDAYLARRSRRDGAVPQSGLAQEGLAETG